MTRDRHQRWECVDCSRSVLIVFHTSTPMPEERTCRCGRPMGLLLFTTNDAPRTGAVEHPRAET